MATPRSSRSGRARSGAWPGEQIELFGIVESEGVAIIYHPDAAFEIIDAAEVGVEARELFFDGNAQSCGQDHAARPAQAEDEPRWCEQAHGQAGPCDSREIHTG